MTDVHVCDWQEVFAWPDGWAVYHSCCGAEVDCDDPLLYGEVIR